MKQTHYETESVQDVLSYPVLAIPERNISQDTAETFGVRTALSPKDGSTPIAHYFPYYDQKGKLTGFKKRDILVDKYDKFHFTTIGKVGVDCQLFGQPVASEIARKRTMLVMVEGEYDVLSAYQAMVEDVAGTKYEGIKPFVAGLSCGTANAVEAVLHNSSFVQSFTKLVLGFDNDSATPAEKKRSIVRGKEATEAVASALMGGAALLLTVQYDGNMKDPSDYVQEGKSKELAKLLTFGHKPFQAEKIVHAADISFEEVITPREKGVMVDDFPLLMEKIQGFRTRELTVLTATSGVGKSMVTSIFAKSFVGAGKKVGMIYLEEENKETLQRLLAHKLKVNYNKFKIDPLSVASEEDIRKAYDEIVESDSAVFLGHFGSLSIHELMNKVRHLHLVEGCDYILLDHLSVVISGLETDNERKQLDMVMTELAAFCAANDVGIIAVSHLNRKASDNANKNLDEPYWLRVDKSHMRGSAALEQLSWLVLGLEVEVMPDGTRGRVRLAVLKNRPYGYLGIADTFSIDNDTWEVVLSNDGSEF